MIVDFLDFTEIKPCFERPFSGVQLMPFNYTPYVVPFRPDMVIPFVVGDTKVYIIDCFGNKTDITKSVKREGDKLVLNNIQYNLDRRVVIHVEMNPASTSNNRVLNLYSNIIKITNEREENTTRVYYKCKDNTLYSTQLQMYEMYSKRSTEIETYTQVSTNNQVSFLPSNVKYYSIQSDMMYIETLNKVIDVFQLNEVYFYNEQVNLFSAPEIDDLEQDVYLTQTKFEVTKLGVKLANNLFLGTDDLDYIVTDDNDKIKVN